jgi:hypothetical protein
MTTTTTTTTIDKVNYEQLLIDAVQKPGNFTPTFLFLDY